MANTFNINPKDELKKIWDNNCRGYHGYRYNSYTNKFESDSSCDEPQAKGYNKNFNSFAATNEEDIYHNHFNFNKFRWAGENYNPNNVCKHATDVILLKRSLIVTVRNQKQCYEMFASRTTATFHLIIGKILIISLALSRKQLTAH